LKVLVTGGAGYIGSILVGQLLDQGIKVDVLDNFLYNQNSLSTYFGNSNFNLIVNDVRNIDFIKSIIKNYDIVIPLAAIVGAPACNLDPSAASSVNKDAILEMLKVVSSNQLIIMPTTNSAYGQGEIGNYCDESTPLKPLSLYAKDKVEIENRLMERSNSISLRLATVFGMSPRMRLDLLVNEFVLRAVKDGYIVIFEGHFKRNYIHIRDVANAFMLAIENVEKFKDEIFNIGLSDANISKIELCEKIQKFIPNFYFTESSINKDPDQRNYIVSNAKVEKLGFKAKYSLDDGIRELIMGINSLKTRNYTNTRI